MVEAGIIAPVFVMFWMLMMQLSGVYQYKILTTQEARYQAFYMAVGDCKSAGAAPTDPLTSSVNFAQSNNGVNDPTEDPTGPAAGKIPNFFDLALSKFSLVADSQAEATWDYKARSAGAIGDKVVYDRRQAGDNGVFHLIPTKVVSTSKVVCSPGKGPDQDKSPSIPGLP